MTLNLIAYLIYALITYWITVRTGWVFYRNGIHFIRAEIGDENVAASINSLLLTGYYLTNLGYITLLIWTWEPIPDLRAMVESLCEKSGGIILLLGGMHYFNMLVIYWVGKRNFFHT